MTRAPSPALTAFAARIVALAATFAMNIAISQSLPLADAGTVVLVITLVTTFATVARCGTDNLALRVTAGEPERMRRLLRPLVLITSTASVVAALAFVLTAAAILDEVQSRGWVIALAAACIAPAAISVLAAAVLRGAGRLASGTMAELGSVPLMVSAGLLLATWAGGGTVLGAVAILCAAYWVTVGWSSAAGWRVLPGLDVPPQGVSDTVRSEGRGLLHFTVTALATFSLVWIPVLALGFFGTTKEVALYNSGARLAAFVGLVSAIQVTYLATEFAKLGAAADPGGISRLARRATRQATVVAGVAAVLLIGFRDWFLGLFGEEYAAAAPVLVTLTLGALVQVMAGPALAVMLTGGQERTASRLTFLACAAAAVACPILAVSGPNAVAVAAAGSVALPAVAGSIVLRRQGIHTSLMGER